MEWPDLLFSIQAFLKHIIIACVPSELLTGKIIVCILGMPTLFRVHERKPHKSRLKILLLCESEFGGVCKLEVHAREPLVEADHSGSFSIIESVNP